MINAGADNDPVYYSSYLQGGTTINLGTGNDQLDLQQNYYAALRVTLGAGQDRVTFGNCYSFNSGQNSNALVFTNFTGGVAGDVLGLNTWLRRT